jgi:hypothetical protein
MGLIGVGLFLDREAGDRREPSRRQDARAIRPQGALDEEVHLDSRLGQLKRGGTTANPAPTTAQSVLILMGNQCLSDVGSEGAASDVRRKAPIASEEYTPSPA